MVTTTGSAAKVARRPWTRFTKAEVIAIREELAAGTATIDELAARSGAHRTTIADIASGRSWTEVGGPTGTKPSPQPRSTSGYWGVTANGVGNRFWVYLRHNGRQVSLGYTTCPEEGARRYDAVARELGFPPEKLNFPDDFGNPASAPDCDPAPSAEPRDCAC